MINVATARGSIAWTLPWRSVKASRLKVGEQKVPVSGGLLQRPAFCVV